MKRLSEAEFRNKITWMTFILSCLVVMIHSYNADLFINGEGTGVFAESVKQVQALVSLAVPSIAVPGFFIISSYLFFRDVSWGEIPDKMTRRVRSVLIPYIVWNTLYYFLFIVVSRIPVLSSVAGKGMVVFSVENLADAIINYNYNPVLWFMQQLCGDVESVGRGSGNRRFIVFSRQSHGDTRFESGRAALFLIGGLSGSPWKAAGGKKRRG